jgi:hypothetical protein
MSERRTLRLPRNREPEPAPTLPECPNPKCIADHKRWPKGNHIHVPGVSESSWNAVPGSIARCYNCGGYWDGQKWTHKCGKCLKEVGQNDLRGMWVPHSCEPCESADIEAQKARGAICSRCRRVSSYCYC